MEGRREETSKLAGDSGSRRSTFIVRQFIVAMMASEEGREYVGGNLCYDGRLWRNRARMGRRQEQIAVVVVVPAE